MYLKPNASLPEFTVLGLDLLCEEASRVVNSRPTAYLGSQDLVISPNHFLLAGFSQNVWGSAGELPTKYLHLQQYRERMFEVLQNMMKSFREMDRQALHAFYLHDILLLQLLWFIAP